MNYYNEIDKYPAQWLLNLEKTGKIPGGHVDQTDIRDVPPDTLRQYQQCHFFAGIGGWPYALRLAGWPEDRPVWTGSCPCQPFSIAGTRKGVEDERHLWPAFRWLIAQCRPPVIFGEQVASKDGREWLSGVRSDLETLGYEVGAADLCAAGVGAPHVRQRLFWVAYSRLFRQTEHEKQTARGQQYCQTGGMGNSKCCGEGRTQRTGNKERADKKHDIGNKFWCDASNNGNVDPWGDFVITPCADGKSRRIESGIMPLAHGVPARAGAIKAYGNAIVPQIASEFIKAFMDGRKFVVTEKMAKIEQEIN